MTGEPAEKLRGVTAYISASADYADLVVMPTLMLDRLRGKAMGAIWSA